MNEQRNDWERKIANANMSLLKEHYLRCMEKQNKYAEILTAPTQSEKRVVYNRTAKYKQHKSILKGRTWS